MTHDQSHSPTSLRIDNRFVLGALILALAWFVGSTFQTESACLAYFLAGMLIGYLGERWIHLRAGHARAFKVNRGIWGALLRAAAILIVMVGALVLVFLWRMAERLTETSSFLMLAVDMLAHYGIVILCILWSVWPRQGHVAMMVIALVTVLMAVAGGGVSTSRTAQTVVGLATVVGFALAAQVIVSRQRVASSSSDERRLNFSSETWPYLLLTLSLFLITASALVQITDTVLPNVQAEVFAQLKDRFESPDSGISWGGAGYVSGGRLGSVYQSINANPKEVALSGYCDNVPGYLRGNVFDSYSQRRWRTRRRWQGKTDTGNVFDVYNSQLVRPSGRASVPLKKPDKLERSRFPLNVSGSVSDNRIFAGTVEIHGQPERGPQMFLPAATMWVEARGEVMGITPHGLVNQGVDMSLPWVAGVAMSTEHEILPDNVRKQLSSVDPSIQNELAKIAAEVCGGAGSPEAKAALVADYFRKNFVYSLEPISPARGVDPIAYFLKTKHPAHCELFASASALMLRTQGIPTRYVTGYVMDELDETKEFYLARNRDAHAWVEYYDDRQQRWVSLETTPGRRYRTLNVMHTELAEGETGLVDDSTPSAALGWLREHWGTLMSLRVTDVVAAAFRALQLPLLIGLVFWLWWRRRGRHRDAQAAALATARRAMDRRLRRWGWSRRRSETLHQFADRLELFRGDRRSEKEIRKQAQLVRAAQWYREHAVALFRHDARPSS